MEYIGFQLLVSLERGWPEVPKIISNISVAAGVGEAGKRGISKHDMTMGSAWNACDGQSNLFKNDAGKRAVNAQRRVELRVLVANA